MKKLALVLCLALLLPTFCVIAGAADYGTDTQKLVITHINETASYEGAGIIYTKSSDGTLTPYGTFDWWYSVSFEWSDSDGCYVVSAVNTATGTAKGTTVIPENGFVYCINTGNNWPELYAQDPVTYASYADAPDYTSPHANDSFAYVANLKIGDKAYLYGTDPVNNVISNNGALWYSDDFTSNSFIKIGSAESDKTAYTPGSDFEIKPEYSFGINAINGGVAEGQSMLLTPDYGTTVTAKGNNYNWCRVAVFDWSAKDGAYVLKSIDTSLGNGVAKDAIIPANGFAISVNKGNDYTASGGVNYINATSSNVYDNISSLEIGTKVYLVGIDLENGTFEYEGDISKYYTSDFTTKAFIKVCENKPEGCYEPDTSGLLDTPAITNQEEIHTLGDIEIKWNAVEGADRYFVCVSESTITPNGPALIAKEVTETSITVSASSLTVGAKITVRIYALGEGGAASEMTDYTFVICSERALNSVFRDKKVVAFGDSITAWTGWVAMMYGELGCEVVNAGVGGDRTTHALDRIDRDVISQNPDLVIVNFGMNDQAVDTSTGKNLTSIEDYEKNYRTIIEKIQLTGSDIILVAVHDVCTSKYGGGSPKYDSVDSEGVTYVDRYNEVVKKLAEEYDLGFLDINSLAQDMLPEIISDGIHLSDKGQQKYCSWISEYCYQYVAAEWNESDGDDSSDSSITSVDESDSTSPAEKMPAWQVAILAVVMFAVIAVIGVMFIKIVMKNKNQ